MKGVKELKETMRASTSVRTSSGAESSSRVVMSRSNAALPCTTTLKHCKGSGAARKAAAKI